VLRIREGRMKDIKYSEPPAEGNSAIEPARPEYLWHPPRKMKMAEKLATLIEADIVSSGWQVGSRLGPESELLQKYGVSRATLREAVRILEHHMVATMKKGPNGGLVVTEPDPSAVTASVALYLEFRSVSREMLFDTRRTLEVACVRQLAEERDEQAIRRLEDVLVAETRLATPADIHVSANDLHVAIAAASGNEAMALFVDVLTKLSQAHIEYASEVYSQNSAAIHEAHVRIVTAIAAGDADLACRRMLSHLDAVSHFYR
jgi:DNA-binding FadR family transcriptional regulator